MDHRPDELLAQALRRDAARPFITYYGSADAAVATGRVELSYATFDNWVAKTANLIVDEVGGQPGERVALALPWHWQAAVWLVSCWASGLVAVPCPVGGPVPPADYVVATVPDLPAVHAREVIGVSLHPLGLPLPECPAGVLDYAAEVRGQGDRFHGDAAADAPALDIEGRVLTGAEVTAAARAAQRQLGLSATDRVLATDDYLTLRGLLAGLLAPLAAGASVVIWADPDCGRLAAVLSAERITAATGPLAESLPVRVLR